MILTKKEINNFQYRLVGAAIEVHKTLGPGLLEKVYQKALEKELDLRGIKYKSEVRVEVDYKGFNIDTDLRCDLIIENAIVVELKSIESILPIHEAQLLTYMKLLYKTKGILINFNVLNLNE